MKAGFRCLRGSDWECRWWQHRHGRPKSRRPRPGGQFGQSRHRARPSAAGQGRLSVRHSGLRRSPAARSQERARLHRPRHRLSTSLKSSTKPWPSSTRRCVMEPKNSEAHRGRGGAYAGRKTSKRPLPSGMKRSAAIPRIRRPTAFAAPCARTRANLPRRSPTITEAHTPQSARRKGPGSGYANEEFSRGEIDKVIADLCGDSHCPCRLRSALLSRAAYYRKSEWDKAVADFSAAIQLKPKTPETFLSGCLRSSER